MTNHDDHVSQPDDQGSMPQAVSVEQADEQEEGRPTDRDTDEQSTQGLRSVQASAQGPSGRQEDEGPQQGALGTPPQGAGEQGDPLMEYQDPETPSTSPEEPLEREAVAITPERLGAAEE